LGAPRNDIEGACVKKGLTFSQHPLGRRASTLY
jgi:hypothetical protein